MGGILLASGLTAARASDPPEFRAFWADAFQVGFKSTSQINALVNRAVAGRYNAIIAEVLAFHDTGGNGRGAYWNSSIVPRASDIPAGFDPLAYLITQAHANGLEVHAWLVPFRVSSTWPPNGNALLAAHPEWLMVPSGDMGNGPARVGGYYTLDAGSPDAQEYLVSIVRELVSNYALDGINLDYVRYVQTDAGYPADANYNASSLARFRTLRWFVGTPPPTGVVAWNDFRRRGIDEFVRRLRAEIPLITQNPRQPVRLSADLICFGNAPANFTSSDAYNLFQNWRMWLELGWLDAGIPMNYKRDYISTQATWYRNWVDAAVNWRYQRHIFQGQATYLNPKADSVAQLLYARQAGSNGMVTYSYVGTADENMDGNWENDWTWYSYISGNLFTQTAPTPGMPWRHSATATEGTLFGRAADPATGTPIDGALIQVGHLPAVETDGNGYFVVTMIPAAPGGSVYQVSGVRWDCPEITLYNVVVWPGTISVQDMGLCSSFVPGDMNGDGLVNLQDLPLYLFCLQGPGLGYGDGTLCRAGDADGNATVDLADLAVFQQLFAR